MSAGREPDTSSAISRRSCIAQDQEYFSEEIGLASLVATTEHRAQQHSSTDNVVISSGDTVAKPDSSVSLLPSTRRPILQHTLRSTTISLRVKSLVLDTWICEAVAMAFSIICLIAIVMIVGLYNHKRLPQFPSGTTLNTIVSILSTAARSSLVYVLGATIGQLRWHWLSQSGRPVRDLQILDDVSRGPLGAVVASFTLIGGLYATIGGAIMVLMIAFGPFVQQVLDYPTRVVETNTSEARVSQNLNYTHLPGLFGPAFTYSVNYDDGITTLLPQESFLGNDIEYAIKAGIYSDPKFFELTSVCATSNCSWDTFGSVGWCAKCEDVIDSATLNDCDIESYLGNAALHFSSIPTVANDTAIDAYLKDFSLRLPNCTIDLGKGVSHRLLLSSLHVKDDVYEDSVAIDLATQAIWPISLGNKQPRRRVAHTNYAPGLFDTNTSYMDVPNPLAVLGYVDLQMNESFQFSSKERLLSIKDAQRCLITLCEKTYKVSVAGGTTKPTVVSTNYGDLFSYEDADDYNFTCWKPGAGPVTLSPSDTEISYQDRDKRASCGVDGYGLYISQSLQSNVTTPVDFYRTNVSEEYQYRGSKNWEKSDSDILGLLSAKDFKAMAEDIAGSLTSYGIQQSNATVVGHAFIDETYVHVRWQWLILPAALELGTLTTFLVTIIRSRRGRLPTWKSSILALLHHDKSPDDAGVPSNRLSDIDKAAGATIVRLVMDLAMDMCSDESQRVAEQALNLFRLPWLMSLNPGSSIVHACLFATPQVCLRVTHWCDLVTGSRVSNELQGITRLGLVAFITLFFRLAILPVRICPYLLLQNRPYS